jgi:hypothetical protein
VPQQQLLLDLKRQEAFSLAISRRPRHIAAIIRRSIHGALGFTAQKSFYSENFGSLASCFAPISNQAHLLVHSVWWQRLTIFVVFFNTVVLSCQYYQMPDTLAQAIFICNSVCVCFFIFEMLITLIGIGLKEYLSSRCASWSIYLP